MDTLLVFLMGFLTDLAIWENIVNPFVVPFRRYDDVTRDTTSVCYDSGLSVFIRTYSAS